jgi:hypothetical protein
LQDAAVGGMTASKLISLMTYIRFHRSTLSQYRHSIQSQPESVDPGEGGGDFSLEGERLGRHAPAPERLKAALELLMARGS